MKSKFKILVVDKYQLKPEHAALQYFYMYCSINWFDSFFYGSICSEIDGLALDGFPSMKMHAGADFTRRTNLRIQWSDVFFMNSGAKTTQFTANKDVNKMLVDLSKACCKALKPHLVMLSQQNLIKIGLRVNMDADSVSKFLSITGLNCLFTVALKSSPPFD